MSHSTHSQLVLTERDPQIFLMAFEYGGVSIAHIQAKHFRTPHGRAACYARIARLVEAGYLIVKRLPSESGLGSGKHFVMVGTKARPVLAKILNCSSSALRRQTRARVPAVLKHHLAICDFRLALELAVETSQQISGFDWTPEWELRRTPITVTDPTTQGRITLVPDAAFALSLSDGNEQTLLAEIDMGTMTAPKRMRTRLRGYLRAAQDNPLPVLWVTPSQERSASIARLAADEAEKLGLDSTIFWTSTQNAVVPETVLTAPIWQIVGGPGAHTLLPAPPEGHGDAPPQRAPVARLREQGVQS